MSDALQSLRADMAQLIERIEDAGFRQDAKASMLSRFSALEAQLAEARRDAERWQWMLSKLGGQVPMVRVQVMYRGQYLLHSTPGALAAAIDAAKEQGNG